MQTNTRVNKAALTKTALGEAAAHASVSVGRNLGMPGLVSSGASLLTCS